MAFIPCCEASNGRKSLCLHARPDSHTPLALGGILTSGVTAVAAGDAHSLAIQNDHVYAWGDNGAGQLGNGGTSDSLSPIQVDATNLHDIIAVAASYQSSYALSADGSLWVWGNNGNGQLGLGTNGNNYYTPQHLLAPSGYEFTSIAGGAGSYHALATLAAIPEPASVAMLVLGASAKLLKRRRPTTA